MDKPESSTKPTVNPTIDIVFPTRSTVISTFQFRMPMGRLGDLERLQSELWTRGTQKEVFTSFTFTNISPYI